MLLIYENQVPVVRVTHSGCKIHVFTLLLPEIFFSCRYGLFFSLGLRENTLSNSPLIHIDQQLIGGPLVRLSCCRYLLAHCKESLIAFISAVSLGGDGLPWFSPRSHRDLGRQFATCK